MLSKSTDRFILNRNVHMVQQMIPTRMFIAVLLVVAKNLENNQTLINKVEGINCDIFDISHKGTSYN